MNAIPFRSRRFLLTLGAGVVTTLLQWNGKLDPAGSTYALVIVATVGAYITGRAVDNKTEANKT